MPVGTMIAKYIIIFGKSFAKANSYSLLATAEMARGMDFSL
jgi:hypothetical protein